MILRKAYKVSEFKWSLERLVERLEISKEKSGQVFQEEVAADTEAWRSPRTASSSAGGRMTARDKTGQIHRGPNV